MIGGGGYEHPWSVAGWVWNVNISLVVMSLVKVMTGHGKRRAGAAESTRMTSLCHLELNWLSCELWAVSSILSKSQSSSVIKMKSIISLKFSWEIFWKLSVKENDKTNVIFMPSFTHNRWSGDAGWLPHPDKTSPVIRRKSIEKYIWKLSVKANDTANVIFMSSFTNNPRLLVMFSPQSLHIRVEHSQCSGFSRSCSHYWSRALENWNIFIVLLRQLSYAIKNQLVASKPPY